MPLVKIDDENSNEVLSNSANVDTFSRDRHHDTQLGTETVTTPPIVRPQSPKSRISRLLPGPNKRTFGLRKNRLPLVEKDGQNSNEVTSNSANVDSFKSQDRHHDTQPRTETVTTPPIVRPHSPKGQISLLLQRPRPIIFHRKRFLLVENDGNSSEVTSNSADANTLGQDRHHDTQPRTETVTTPPDVRPQSTKSQISTLLPGPNKRPFGLGRKKLPLVENEDQNSNEVTFTSANVDTFSRDRHHDTQLGTETVPKPPIVRSQSPKSQISTLLPGPNKKPSGLRKNRLPLVEKDDQNSNEVLFNSANADSFKSRDRHHDTQSGTETVTTPPIVRPQSPKSQISRLLPGTNKRTFGLGRIRLSLVEREDENSTEVTFNSANVDKFKSRDRHDDTQPRTETVTIPPDVRPQSPKSRINTLLPGPNKRPFGLRKNRLPLVEKDDQNSSEVLFNSANADSFKSRDRHHDTQLGTETVTTPPIVRPQSPKSQISRLLPGTNKRTFGLGRIRLSLVEREDENSTEVTFNSANVDKFKSRDRHDDTQPRTETVTIPPDVRPQSPKSRINTLLPGPNKRPFGLRKNRLSLVEKDDQDSKEVTSNFANVDTFKSRDKHYDTQASTETVTTPPIVRPQSPKGQISTLLQRPYKRTYGLGRKRSPFVEKDDQNSNEVTSNSSNVDTLSRDRHDDTQPRTETVTTPPDVRPQSPKSRINTLLPGPNKRPFGFRKNRLPLVGKDDQDSKEVTSNSANVDTFKSQDRHYDTQSRTETIKTPPIVRPQSPKSQISTLLQRPYKRTYWLGRKRSPFKEKDDQNSDEVTSSSSNVDTFKSRNRHYDTQSRTETVNTPPIVRPQSPKGQISLLLPGPNKMTFGLGRKRLSLVEREDENSNEVTFNSAKVDKFKSRDRHDDTQPRTETVTIPPDVRPQSPKSQINTLLPGPNKRPFGLRKNRLPLVEKDDQDSEEVTSNFANVDTFKSRDRHYDTQSGTETVTTPPIARPQSPKSQISTLLQRPYKRTYGLGTKRSPFVEKADQNSNEVTSSSSNLDALSRDRHDDTQPRIETVTTPPDVRPQSPKSQINTLLPGPNKRTFGLGRKRLSLVEREDENSSEVTSNSANMETFSRDKHRNLEQKMVKDTKHFILPQPSLFGELPEPGSITKKRGPFFKRDDTHSIETTSNFADATMMNPKMLGRNKSIILPPITTLTREKTLNENVLSLTREKTLNEHVQHVPLTSEKIQLSKFPKKIGSKYRHALKPNNLPKLCSTVKDKSLPSLPLVRLEDVSLEEGGKHIPLHRKEIQTRPDFRIVLQNDIESEARRIQQLAESASKNEWEKVWQVIGTPVKPVRSYLINIICNGYNWGLLHIALSSHSCYAFRRLLSFDGCDPSIQTKEALHENEKSQSWDTSSLMKSISCQLCKQCLDKSLANFYKECPQTIEGLNNQFPLLSLTLAVHKHVYHPECISRRLSAIDVLRNVFKDINSSDIRWLKVQELTCLSIQTKCKEKIELLQQSKTRNEFYKAVIDIYTTETNNHLYLSLNEALRRQRTRDYHPTSADLELGPFILILEMILLYWSELEKEDGVTYRRMALTDEDLDKYKVGGRFTWMAFVSSSRKKDKTLRFPTSKSEGDNIVDFVIDNSTVCDWQPRNIEQYAALAETERVYPAGARFEVKSKTVSEESTVIELKLIK